MCRLRFQPQTAQPTPQAQRTASTCPASLAQMSDIKPFVYKPTFLFVSVLFGQKNQSVQTVRRRWIITSAVVAVVSLLMLWQSWVWLDERRATKYVSGLDLPQAAQFIESFGSRNEPVYVWRLDQAILSTIGPPAGHAWQPFDQRFFGSLEPERISSTAGTATTRASSIFL